MGNEHIFEKSAGERPFWLADGTRIDSIRELYEAMDKMNEQIFSHHVNPEKNDFGMWINDVFEASNLAANIFNLSERSEIKKVMGDWISYRIQEKHEGGDDGDDPGNPDDEVPVTEIHPYLKLEMLAEQLRKVAEEEEEVETTDRTESSGVEQKAGKSSDSKKVKMTNEGQQSSDKQRSSDNDTDERDYKDKKEDTAMGIGESNIREQIHMMRHNSHFFSGVMDFVLGFIVGTISMVLLMKVI